jgi:hypothetical protein
MRNCIADLSHSTDAQTWIAGAGKRASTISSGRTPILDFQNEIEDIQLAFKPFYEAAALEETSHPNQIYELDAKLKTFGILDPDEIERFAAIFYKGPLDPADRIRLEGLVRQAVQRFELEDAAVARQGVRRETIHGGGGKIAF